MYYLKVENMTITAERFEEILNQTKKLSPILVLGDIGLDKYTYGEVSRISPEAPVPVLEVQKEWKKLGFNCANEILENGGAELMIAIKNQLKTK